MVKNNTGRKQRKKFLRLPLHLLPEEPGGLYRSPRERAASLRARMLQFHGIYNAAWHVRYTQHGAPDQRQRKVEQFVKALRRELEGCHDPEALIFAVADSLTAFPRGLPWEG